MRLTIAVAHTLLATLTLASIACKSDGPSASETGEGTDSATTDASTTSDADTETGTTTDGTSTTDDETTDGTDTDDETDTATTSPESDMGMSGDCDPFAQDCLDGQKCVPFQDEGGDWSGYKCVEILGQQVPGEACVYDGFMAATDDCDGTGACWGVKDVDGELVGTCLDFCTGSADAPSCADGSHCLGGSNEIYLCVFGCDPLLQDCGVDEGCYWSGDFNCKPQTDNIPIGEPCGFTNDCEPGATCANAQFVPDCAGSDCCVAFCDVDLGDDQCAALPDSSCVAFLPPSQAPVGYEHIGVCVVL